jgi:hypothetical protein
MDADTIHAVGETETRTGHRGGPVRVGQQSIAETAAFGSISCGFVAVYETGKVELKLVAFTRCIRALNLTELALKAGTHDPFGLFRGDSTDVALVPVVEEIEKNREAVAVLEAHPASVADLEGTCDFLGESLRLPVPLVFRIVTQALSGLI